MKRKWSIEKKLEILSKIEAGTPLTRVCAEHRLCHHDVGHWLTKYKLYGIEGLQEQPAKCFAPKLKEEIVRQHIENFVPLSKLSIIYDVSRSTLKKWILQVRIHGYADLYSDYGKRKGLRAMGRTKKKEPKTELEILQAENLRLRAEVAYLKKLRALVQEQNSQQNSNGHKSSKN